VTHHHEVASDLRKAACSVAISGIVVFTCFRVRRQMI